jgi:hypothetical protein
MNDSEYYWNIRVSWQERARSTVYARNNSFTVERQASFKEADAYPSAVEYFLGALAADLIAGFERQANQSRVSLDALEVSLKGRLHNPLLFLGVVGEEAGYAGFDLIECRIYVTAEAEESLLRQIWEIVQLRSPLLNTLRRCEGLALHLELKPVI